MSDHPVTSKARLFISVLAAALGFLVDAYDLLLFNALRVPSLRELGIEGDALTRQGLWLLNLQLAGSLLGGLGWGVMGDKFGRQNVLFGSILVFSLATLANTFVTDLFAHAEATK